jgi:aminoglycoside phosphotransferase (APT) family kinase protein
MAAKELAVQSAAAQAGIPTPRIHLTGPAGGPLGGAWALMDLAPGAPLLADLDGTAALARLPRILRRLPGQLATTLAAVHHVDPTPIVERVRSDVPDVAFSVEDLWPHLRSGATAAERPDLVRALDQLAQHRPAQDEPALCHGDFHPLNLLADDERVTLIDWTGALLAPPAFDVAFTALLLRHPPLPTPAPLRPMLHAGGARLARRFLHRYRQANPTADLAALDWYTALHSVRILAEHTTWTRAGDPRARHHPWRLVAPGAARAVHRATGVTIDSV